ncbi:MAG: malto-oligosyltrehalose synthase [Candidatus Dormibacteria bacterium]
MSTAGTAPGLVCTYRLQLHAGFTFADATAVVPYLAGLGVSHLYLSPILQAAPGSTHGYDQCDPTQVNAEIGGESGFRRLASTVRAHGMGIILDIVPNHMATSETNPWWWELLRSGRDGRAGVYFDVDWDAPGPGLRGRVMVPVLGAPLGEVLAGGELAVVEHNGDAALAYRGQHFPLANPAQSVPGAPVTDSLLDQQHYRLAFWRDAARHLNYRRFFAIDSLVAVREEDPVVFVTFHALPIELLQAGDVQGLRVDHVDGLRDPQRYLDTLRSRAPEAWLLVEKILEPGESLPVSWPVDGSTGYDFIQRLQGVFIDPSAESPLTRFYSDFTGERAAYADVVRSAKLEAAQRLFVPDVARLERLLDGVCRAAGVNVTSAQRIAVIEQVATALPVYRTYARPGAALTGEAKAMVKQAVDAAAQVDGSIPAELLALVAETLAMEQGGEAAAEFATCFQQLSGPLMAKGVEDTAFYRYNRLASLNEVGGDPGRFAISPDEFHAANGATLRDHPRAMLASSTHDTKRSEDVRARLSLLTQIPAQWAAAVTRWSAMNEGHRTDGFPDRNAEYLLYQTLVGAWPLGAERTQLYMEKAARETSQHTSWTDPDQRYEDALRGFVAAVLADKAFQADLAAFVEPLIEPGRQVALAQALLKLTAPGVPDLYQGTELWDLSLVDPDNRRPVDYGLRRELLARQEAATEAGMVDRQLIQGRWNDGLAKLHVVARALQARRRFPAAFGPGSTYTLLAASGPAAGNVLAYARGTTQDRFLVIVVVPRLTLRGAIEWSSTRLKVGTGRWAETLWAAEHVDGPALDLGEAFQSYPLALLERTG